MIIRGLSPAEAGNLTAYLHGLSTHRQGPWRLAQVQQLLLRELHRTGRTH